MAPYIYPLNTITMGCSNMWWLNNSPSWLSFLTASSRVIRCSWKKISKTRVTANCLHAESNDISGILTSNNTPPCGQERNIHTLFFSDRVFEICTKQLFSLLITLTRIKIYNGWFTNIYKHVIIICAYTFIFREHCRHDRVIYSSRETCNLVWCVWLWYLLFPLSQIKTVTSYIYLGLFYFYFQRTRQRTTSDGPVQLCHRRCRSFLNGICLLLLYLF